VDDEAGDSNDQIDAGFDAEGNCIGQIYLFSGENKQCRLQSIKNPFMSCCQSNSSWKPRFRCNDVGTMYDDAKRCGEICGKPCDLLKSQPPDLEMDILGIPLDVCKAEEKELSFRRSMFPQGGNCKYIGERCTERWKFGFGSICVQRKETYCCYQTPLAKTVMEAAHDQLGISWGSAGSPNCRGITPEEFSQVNLDQVDFSAWIEGYVLPAVGNQAANLLEKMQLP
jgi:conjugal transfer mating pair stabilization protein TraN